MTIREQAENAAKAVLDDRIYSVETLFDETALVAIIATAIEATIRAASEPLVAALRAYNAAMDLPPGEYMTALCEAEEVAEAALAAWDAK